MSNKLFAFLLVALVAVFSVSFWLSHPGGSKPTKMSQQPALNSGNYPWPYQGTSLASRLSQASLPMLKSQTSASYAKTHLDIYINGHHVGVPSGIGLTADGTAPLQTSSSKGVINVDKAGGPYTLGQFFSVWGVKLTNTRIGAYQNSTSHTLSVYTDCKRQPDPLAIVLQPNQEVAINYGPSSKSVHVPCSYKF